MISGMSLMQWIENPWVMHVYFLSLRIAAILTLTPLFSAANLPITVRTLLILVLSVAISAGMSDVTATSSGYGSGVGWLVVASLKELVWVLR